MADQTISQETLDNTVPADADVLYMKSGITRRATRAAFVGGIFSGNGTWINSGYTFTVPATGTAALRGVAQTFTAAQTFSAALTASAGANITGDVSIEGQTLVTSPDFPPLRAERTTTDTNATVTGMDMRVTTSGNMADGFGPLVSFSIQDDADVSNQIAALGAVREGADNSGAIGLFTRLAGVILERFHITAAGLVGVNRNTSIRGQLDVDQSSGSGAVPVLVLDQADLTQPFITLVSTVGAGNPIDTTTALGTLYGHIQVSVGGVGEKRIPLYNP